MSSKSPSKKITNSQLESLQGDNDRVYEFLNFRLDVAGRSLKRGDVPIAMTPKLFDMLVMLVESAGNTVPKNEFLSRIWPDTVVEEANLTQSIFLLRKLLGEKESGEKMILTRSGVGYMFVPRINQGAPLAAAARLSMSRTRSKGFLIAAVAAAVLALAWLAVGIYRGSRISSSPIRKWELSARPGLESFPALSPDGI